MRLPSPTVPAVLIACVLAGCGAPPTTAVADTEIELEAPLVLSLREGDLPVVRASVDGHGEHFFLLDSGSSLSVIDLDRATELGLFVGPCSQGASTRGSGGASVSYDSYAKIDRLGLGDAALERIRLPALDLSFLHGFEVLGILGQDLLARLIVLVDVPHGELHLLPAGTDVETYLGDAGVASGAWIQAEVELRPCPFLDLAIDGVEAGAAEVEIDTGATSTSLPGVALDALGLVPTGVRTSLGIDGVHEKETYQLSDFILYEFRISCEVRRSSLEYGLLGMDVLGKFVFVLDGPRGLFWLHHRDVPLNRSPLEPSSEEPGGRDAE